VLKTPVNVSAALIPIDTCEVPARVALLDTFHRNIAAFRVKGAVIALRTLSTESQGS
jgi:hypothetical protein